MANFSKAINMGFFYVSQTKCRIELPIMIIIFGLKHIYEVDKMI